MVGRPPRAPFVRGHDSGRSPMAAALLAHRTGDGVGVSSAGTGPTSPPC